MRHSPFFFIKNISFLLLFLFIAGIVAFILPGCNPIIALGRNPKGMDLEKIEKLPNYKNGEFQNLYSVPPPPVNITTSRRPRWLGMLKYFFGKEEITRPSERLPVVITELKKTTWKRPTVIWFGHSSFLIKSVSGNILVDPNFSGYAGPFPGMVDAFKGADAYTTDDMPPIDALVISHDHYDHLDYKTVKKIRKKVKRVIVPVGVGSHFRRWGYDAKMITELNWNQSAALSAKLNITATPAHHR
ncbi:MAG TPA: MBL fold metallo-hydrolase, partial [Flavisolibacter sp.]